MRPWKLLLFLAAASLWASPIDPVLVGFDLSPTLGPNPAFDDLWFVVSGVTVDSLGTYTPLATGPTFPPGSYLEDITAAGTDVRFSVYWQKAGPNEVYYAFIGGLTGTEYQIPSQGVLDVSTSPGQQIIIEVQMLTPTGLGPTYYSDPNFNHKDEYRAVFTSNPDYQGIFSQTSGNGSSSSLGSGTAISNQGSNNQGISNQGTSDQGSSGQGSSNQGSSTQGSSSQGSNVGNSSGTPADAAVPEPVTSTLIGRGLLFFGLLARRTRRTESRRS